MTKSAIPKNGRFFFKKMTLLLFTICYGFVPLLLFSLIRKKVTYDAFVFLPFIILVFVASLYELIGSILLQYKVKYWFTFYNILVFLTLYHFYYTVFDGQFRKVFLLFMFFFIAILVFICFKYTIDDVLIYNSYFKGLQTIFILAFSLLWFRKIFNEAAVTSLKNEPVYYFISGLIIYYCGTFFLFLLSSLIYVNDENAFHDYWLLNIILNLVLRTLLIVTVWKARLK